MHGTGRPAIVPAARSPAGYGARVPPGSVSAAPAVFVAHSALSKTPKTPFDLIIAVTQNTFNVEYKKFGVLLNITPTADRSGNIGTEIFAEVSAIDRTISVLANGVNVPGFKVRNVKTNVSVHDGETIVLSGLYNYSEDKEVSKLPLLGNIPILGELFKSRNFIDNKTELAIYITPRVVTPGQEQVEKIIQDSRERYKEAGKSVSFSIFD